VIWSQEVGRYVTPDGFFVIGQGMCGPTLMAYASEEQKRQLLPPLARGDAIWCQLFSEPVAGSDLAGIKTRAERRGDDWLLNGQKIWTSGAHYSDFGIIITRTDIDVPKHKGLTMFFIDMKSPGIEIRPIKQMNGDRAFNEVFFTDVRVPDAQRLGAVGQGWQVSLVTLMNERLAVGGSLATRVEPLMELAAELSLNGEPALANPAVRERLATWYAQLAGLKYTGFRMVSALSRGQTPGPEASISKVGVARMNQDMANFALDLQGQAGILDSIQLSAMHNQFQRQFMRSPANRIEGGSDEILRNIIAERVLGLPPDIRVDKDLPFREVPQN
jgi:acyl-CoA dehydrogenase